MVYTYTAAFRQSSDGYNVFAKIPDIEGCVATGEDLQNAIIQITNALMGFLLVYEDENMPVPTPTAQKAIERTESDILSDITVDTTAYRNWLEILYPFINDLGADSIAFFCGSEKGYLTIKS